MKKLHSTREQRHARQVKNAARNKRRGKANRSAWINSKFTVAFEVALHLAYRFVELNNKVVSPVGVPTKQYIRRQVEGLTTEDLEKLRDKLLAGRDLEQG